MKLITVRAIDYLGRTIKAKTYRAKNWGEAGDKFRAEFPALHTVGGPTHHITCEEVKK